MVRFRAQGVSRAQFRSAARTVCARDMPCARKRGRNGLVFPCFVFYPMTMTRIGIVIIDNTVVTKVPCAMVRESPPYW